MLNAYFGPMPEAIYNTAVYFKNTYRDSWITNPMSVEMIKDVDKSDVVSAPHREPGFGQHLTTDVVWRREDPHARQVR